MQSMNAQAKEGFTLIEIVVAVLIIGLLVGMGIGAFRWLGKAKVTKTEANLRTLKNQIDLYRMEFDKYPTKLTELEKPPRGKPFFDEVPRDGWDSDFVYKLTPGGKHPYELYSEGDPGEPESERINVWELGKKKREE